MSYQQQANQGQYAPDPYSGKPAGSPYGQQPPYDQGGAYASPKDEGGEIQLGERFHYEPIYRDKPFAIAFILHLIILVGALITCAITKAILEPSDEPWMEPISGSDIMGIALGCVLSSIFAAGFALVWLMLMKMLPVVMIWISMLFAVAMWFIFAGIFFAIGLWIAGLFFLIPGFILAIVFFFWRHRIKFSGIMMKNVVRLMGEFKGTTVVSLISILFYFAFFMIWSTTVVLIQQFDETLFAIFSVALILSWFWTMQVIKNIVHSTISGSCGSWYFDNMSQSVTTDALKRSCTTSLGSICFGSLLVALIQTLKVLVAAAEGNQRGAWRLVGMCIRACLSVIEDVLKWFNKFAYVYISLYGIGYLDAGKATFNLLASRGIDVVVNDLLIGSVIGLGIMFGSMLTTLVAVLYLYTGLVSWDYVWFMFVLGMTLGIGIVIVTLEVVDSSVTALMVCLCEQPELLKNKMPELYAAIEERYAERVKMFQQPHSF